jgi:hypothetical protein
MMVRSCRLKGPPMHKRAPLSAVMVILAAAMVGCRAEKPAVTPPESTTSPAATPTPATPTPATTSPEALTIQMKALNNSGQSGTATLTAVDGRTRVQIELANPAPEDQPVHVHSGTCSKLGSVEHPLSNVVNGRSDTTIDVSLPDLLSSQSAINVHRSGSQASVYVSCGEIAA